MRCVSLYEHKRRIKMIQVHVLNSNNIITLDSPGKLPIKSSQGYMFYNSNELLCVAVGACIGRQIVIYASNNKIDLTVFEFFGVDMKDNKIEVRVHHPDDFDPKELVSILKNCEISNKINLPIEIITSRNTTSTKELREQNEKKPCCGEAQ